MLNETKQLLRDFYRPFNQRLTSMLRFFTHQWPYWIDYTDTLTAANTTGSSKPEN